VNTAKIFRSGNSQAVRLPKEFQFTGDEVYIRRVGRGVVLIPKNGSWEMFEQSLGEFSRDYMEGERIQPPLEDREEWQ